jgi:hypothetical protein
MAERVTHLGFQAAKAWIVPHLGRAVMTEVDRNPPRDPSRSR